MREKKSEKRDLSGGLLRFCDRTFHRADSKENTKCAVFTGCRHGEDERTIRAALATE